LVDLERLQNLIESVVAAEGMELVELEYKGSSRQSILRIYIDKPGGITHSDCEFISNQVGPLMEVEDLIPGSHVLEVSSPGLTRKLTKVVDYQRYQGRLTRIQTREPGGGSRNFRGTIRGIDEQKIITLELKDGTLASILLQTIVKANLDIEF
jgi:ribosome maturation factor RimP